MPVRLLLIPVLSFLALAASACGGGGGSTTGTTAPPTPPGVSMSAAEAQLATDALDAMNAHRAGKGLAPLAWYQAGAQVGYAHGLAMEAGGFFAHTDPGTGTTPASRAFNAGIVHDPQGSIDPISGKPFVGENLALATGQPSVTFTGADAVNGWIASPGHHAQIDAPLPVAGAQTMPAWTHCGIGVRVTTTQIWYTAMFFRNPN